MANKKHLDRLRKGVATWNNWRRGSTEVVDLSDADLQNADLGAIFLDSANLSGADLRGANLNVARMSGADLTSADLSGADLSQADLSFVRLSETNLSKANLTEVAFWETIFADLDLTDVIGLPTCYHSGPSVIDFRTLAKSHPLPLAFLQGVGLPDNVIDNLPSLLSHPVQYHSCFISYSSKDDDFVKRIYDDLQNKGVRCWFAPHDLRIGDKIRDEIDDAIRVRDKVLLILSKHSIGSGWVEDEVEAAYEEEQRREQTVLFPIRLDDTVMKTREAWAAKLRRSRNIGDFRQWKDDDRYSDVFESVLRALAARPKKAR